MFALYGIWDDLAAWKILLWGAVVICLQVWKFASRSVNNCYQWLDLDPNSKNKKAKARPVELIILVVQISMLMSTMITQIRK
jgi:hypothetical protein